MEANIINITEAADPRVDVYAEGVAEPPLVKAPRIGYFGRIGDFSRFVRIFDSQDVENRLYNKKTAKIGLFRPIFVCFYAISGY